MSKAQNSGAGKVIFSTKELIASNASETDAADLSAAIVASWQHYLQQDIEGYTAMLAPDITRMSQRLGELQQGKEAAIATLPKEWEAFERPQGAIAETMKILRLELTADRNREATAATAIYWVEVTGGARWDYSDLGLVFQAFIKQNGQWKIAHQIDSWSADYNLSQNSPGKETFEFSFVYPVGNLQRAIDFYTPILGKPSAIAPTRAYFNLKGVQFILDAQGLNKYSSIQKGIPNGYAIFPAANLAAERDRLRAKKVDFLDGTDREFKTDGADIYAICADPSGNVFVLQQQNFDIAKNGNPPAIRGFSNTNNPYLQATAAIAKAWLETDAGKLSNYYSQGGRWFDDTRTKIRGMEAGDNLKSVLPKFYWHRYDRSPQGLMANMDVSSVRVKNIGDRAIVSYEMALTGTGQHPFTETAFVTHLFANQSQIANTFIASANSTKAMALELDYTGYPVTNLKQAEKFYTETLRLGSPYSDTDWRGYWSNRAVFGIYTATADEDKLPRRDRANGYVSFWVRSMQTTYQYLQQQGAKFPVIPAINDKSGINAEPGYKQVYATDSEGNGLVFSEYTGKRD